MHNTEKCAEPQDARRVRRRAIGPIIVGALLILAGGAPAQTRVPVVHVVLFYSPTCPHCERVIADHLTPAQERYGDSLVILAFDVGTEEGRHLFLSAMERYGVRREDWGVPFMIVDHRVLSGSLEIPRRLPSLIDEGLATGGIDLPDLPALIELLEAWGALTVIDPGPRYLFNDPSRASAEVGPAVTPGDSSVADHPGAPAPDSPSALRAGEAATPDSAPRLEAGETAAPDSASGLEAGQTATPDSAPALEAGDSAMPDSAPRLQGGEALSPESGEPGDPGAKPTATRGEAPRAGLPTAPTTAWDRFARDPTGGALATALLGFMLLVLFRTADPRRGLGKPGPGPAVPALAGIGLVVALYLSYVEVTGSPATCGPVGDCNTVQQSAYATLFGVLPIGLLGVAAYIGLLLLWMLRRAAAARLRAYAALGLWGGAYLGTAFSAYLTFLEPFVIGAVCLWCLTSALVMALLLLCSSEPAARALRNMGARHA